MEQHETQSVKMNSSENNLSQGTSNNILFLNIFRVSQNTSISKKSWNITWENWFEFSFQIYISGIVNTLKAIINIFPSHIGILFNNIFKIIKLAHFSALDSGPIWLFTLKYGDQNDISIKILWLVSAFFLWYFCLLVRSFLAIK